MAKIKIEPFPNADCVSVCVTHENRGPVGRKHGNPSVGWVIYYQQVASQIYKNCKEAKKAAEEIYAIKGWMKQRGGPYHHNYAIPDDKPEKKITKYRSIDAPSNLQPQSSEV